MSSDQKKPAKIAILHHTGGGNLGDDAIMDVVIHNIRSRWPDAEIAAFSMNPGDTGSRFVPTAVAYRRNGKKLDLAGIGQAAPHRHFGGG